MIQVRAKITRNRMRELSARGRQSAATWNAKLAQEAARLARDLVPVDTGALRDSIAVELNQTTGSATLTAGNAQVDYAPFIEYGTTFMDAKPFIAPAIRTAMQRSRSRRVTMFRG